MTHKECMAALVEAGEKVESITEIEYPAGIHKYHEMARAAFNARPSIALAAEIVEAAKVAVFDSLAFVEQEEHRHGREFRAGRALRALDALLQRWEGKE